MRIRDSDNDRDLESGCVSPPRYSSLSVRSRETLPSPGELDVEMGDLSRRPDDGGAASSSAEHRQPQQQQQPQATTTTAVASVATQTTAEPRQQQDAATTATPACKHWPFSEFARAAMTVIMGAWALGAVFKMIGTGKTDAQEVERLKHIMITVNAGIAIVCIGVEKLLRLAKKSRLPFVICFWIALCFVIAIGGAMPWWDPNK
ncbi:hypothetical protein BC567DRAFT_12788 [Phyllosticta citribraziliensis]